MSSLRKRSSSPSAARAPMLLSSEKLNGASWRMTAIRSSSLRSSRARTVSASTEPFVEDDDLIVLVFGSLTDGVDTVSKNLLVVSGGDDNGDNWVALNFVSHPEESRCLDDRLQRAFQTSPAEGLFPDLLRLLDHLGFGVDLGGDGAGYGAPMVEHFGNVANAVGVFGKAEDEVPILAAVRTRSANRPPGP